MFKMSFRRIDLVKGGWFLHPYFSLGSYFCVDIIESEIFPFIIYGSSSDTSLKFKIFDNLENLNRAVYRILVEKSNRNYIWRKLEDDRNLFINYSSKEFIQDYLSRSWNYNNRIISRYLAETSFAALDLRNIIENYSHVAKIAATKTCSDSTPSIFDRLSDTDKNDLKEHLKEAGVEFNLTVSPCDNSTDKLVDIAKIYLQNPLFGRF